MMTVPWILFLVAVPAAESRISGPEPLWGDDILVWDMTENSTYAGPGYTYCDGIYDLQGNLYALSIIDSTGTQGDVLKIFTAMEGGSSWGLANLATGGPWVLTDPVLMLHGTHADPDSNYISIFITATYPDSSAGPVGFRLLRGDFSFDGFMQPPWVPGVDTLRSIAVACQPTNNELWLFGENTDRTIWLTRSTDDGNTWSDLELIAEDGERPSADYGSDDWVYMTYKRYSDNMIMCNSFSSGSYYETEVFEGTATSAPICAAERTGSGAVAVIFHDQNYEIRMALSDDNPATWTLSPAIAKGMYPFIDVFRASGSSALAYLDYTTETIFFANAASIALLPGQRPTPISGQYPFMGGPPVVRHGVLPTEVALFYMGRGVGSPAPRDLWFDNSLLTPHGVSGDPEQPAMTAGPNPFSSVTTIRFSLAAESGCTLDVYSLDGRLVEHAFSGSTDGEQLQVGSGLPTGVYTAVLRTADGAETLRLVRL